MHASGRKRDLSRQQGMVALDNPIAQRRGPARSQRECDQSRTCRIEIKFTGIWHTATSSIFPTTASCQNTDTASNSRTTKKPEPYPASLTHDTLRTNSNRIDAIKIPEPQFPACHQLWGHRAVDGSKPFKTGCPDSGLDLCCRQRLHGGRPAFRVNNYDEVSRSRHVQADFIVRCQDVQHDP